MKKEIEQKELYQAPLSKEFLITIKRSILTLSPNGYNPEGDVQDMEPGDPI